MRKPYRSAVLVLLICAVTAPLPAAENVATLRFSSLDAVLADVERVSALTGEARTRDQWLRDSLGPLGIGDGAWIDGDLPIVVTLPANGLMNMGWVGALPVKNTAEALAGLEARLGAPEVDGDLRAFVSTMGATIQVRPVENYLLFGQAATAVREADLKQLLEVEELPPGNVVLDLDLVPLTAMAQIGMAAARQGVAENLELDESDTAGREAAMSMYDLYVGLLNDTLLNARRLQLSVEVGSENLRIHKWLLPRDDSTLARLLKAQKSGFPDIARRVNADSAVAVMASSIDITDDFRDALREFSQGYTRTMAAMGESMSGDEGEWFLALMGPWTKMADKWIDCVRGDTAAAYGFDAETGFRATQMAGLEDAEGCAAMADDIGKAMAAVSEMPEGRAFAVVQQDALVYSGVRAMRLEVDMSSGGMNADEETREFSKAMFGGDKYVYYLGSKGSLLLSTGGVDAERTFKGLVDNLSSKKKRGGITARQFEPMKTTSGYFVALDAARLLRELPKLDPDDEDLQQLHTLADKAGRWVFGTHLNPDALRIELSVPLSALEIIAALNDYDDAAEHEEDGDPHGHAEESGEETAHPQGSGPS